jgi:hypothetical protein
MLIFLPCDPVKAIPVSSAGNDFFNCNNLATVQALPIDYSSAPD